MTKNHIVKSRTSSDVDTRVERVLRSLGNPEPPLRLEHVRDFLKLDRHYFTADDPSIVREFVSRVRIGTMQVFKRPTLLAEAVKKWSLQALYLPDSKRILLDASIPEKKHRWSEAHEVGHSLLPWHEEVMHGDNKHTLLASCQEQIEAEANYAAGQLLFLRDRFSIEANDLPLSLGSIQSLHKNFGNTLSSTLWRFVETVGVQRPVVGMITCHPHPTRRPSDFNPAQPCRHCIQSRAFASHFRQMTEATLFEDIASYVSPKMGGHLGSAEVILIDDNGDGHVFSFESFFIRYKAPAVGEALTLGVYQRPYFRSMAM